MRVTICIGVCLLAICFASNDAEAKRRKRRRNKRRAPSSKQVQPPEPLDRPEGTDTDGLAELSPEELIARARTRYADLELDEILPLTEAVLARPDVDIELRLDGYWLQGAALSVMGDLYRAEEAFRYLLRGRPDFDLPPDAPPKIARVFHKVRAEERAMAEELEELERKRIMAEMALQSEVPQRAVGGEPLAFVYRLRDPRQAVARSRVHYKLVGAPAFSALALEPQNDGRWMASLPAEITANDGGLSVEYFVVTEDRHGVPLLTEGSEAAPLRVELSPGQPKTEVPLYRSGWLWGIASGVALGLGAGGWALYQSARSLPENDGRLDFP